MLQFVNNLFKALENIPDDTHEEYLEKLEKYKDVIDRTPNRFLKFHLDDQVKKEHYELAEYIKQTAARRQYKL